MIIYFSKSGNLRHLYWANEYKFDFQAQKSHKKINLRMEKENIFAPYSIY